VTTRRWLVLGAALTAVGVVVFLLFTTRQQPRLFWDSNAYLETARQPFALAQLFYPKPLFVPMVYRWIGDDVYRIATVQEIVVVVAWTALAWAWVPSLRTTRARLVAAFVVLLFVTDATRIGYCDVILSEAIDDALVALLAAAIILMASLGPRPWLLALATIVSLAWVSTRDTNAVIAVIACALVAVGWRRTLLRRPLAIAALVTVIGASVFELYSATVEPPPTHLTFQIGWPADFTMRTSYSALNNVADRVLPDPDARAFFVARGLPQVDELVQVHDRARIFADAHYEPARRWIERSAMTTWLSYVAHHPIATTDLLVSDYKTLLGAGVANGGYLPDGAIRSWNKLRGLTANGFVLVALAALAVLAWWRARGTTLARVAGVVIASGLAGSVAAYLGDSAEVGRHCYGSGQQVALGLVLVCVAALDRARGINDP
jgi:hypothetical protein